MAEHEKRRDFPDEMEGFHKIKDRKYGHIILSLYGHPDKGSFPSPACDKICDKALEGNL